MREAELKNKYIVYIGRKLSGIDGGSVVSRRNLKFLKEASGDKVLEFYLKDKTSFDKFLNIILGNPWGYSRKVYKNLKRTIEKFEISLVFIDHSLLGGFAYSLKKFNIPIIVFFHNVELLYYKDKVLVDGFLNNFMVFFAKRNELMATKYSNKNICLTSRDSNSLLSVYGRGADLILPITMEDKYQSFSQVESKENYHLFVGSAFFANIDGIRWYIDNVLDFINSKLIIIGNGMELLGDGYKNHPRIEINGFVENLGKYYYNADFVINPVHLGSGMKTKTVEALMYGKTVIGTGEAFVGIGSVEEIQIGYECNSAKEFINCINKFNGEKFNVSSRNHYLNNFAMNLGYNKLEQFLISEV